MSIEIISAGLQTTIQDLGRKGWAHMGVPESGGADKLSLKLANLLLNKALNSPVIECTLTGPTLKFLKTYSLVITGADMNPMINDRKVKMNTVIRVYHEDILSLDSCLEGCRAYIALSENILTDEFLGSVSTYLPGKLGGFDGQALSDDSLIKTKPCESEHTNFQNLNFGLNIPFKNEWELRVMKGPEFDFVEETSKKDIFTSIFSVSNDSNRMGNRLNGVKIQLVNNDQMISCPMSIGTIQCPENGFPIILGCDSQTLGGYPRILQVAAVDLHLIGQLRPNDSITFKKVTIDQARGELKKQDSLIPS